VVDLDPALGEQLFDVAVGQAEAQVPADRQHDYIRREAEAGEGGARGDRPVGAVSGSHGRSVSVRTTSRPTQQSLWSYLDMTALGRQEEWEDSPEGYPQTEPYRWWRLHDEYGVDDRPVWNGRNEEVRPTIDEHARGAAADAT
jgi:hypothetical protein